MDYKRRNILLGCLLTFAEIWTLISSININFTKYYYEHNLDGYRCVPNETVIETDNVLGYTQCCKECHLSKKCRSVFYQPESKKCIGCRLNPRAPSCIHEPLPGSKYLRTKPIYRNKVVPASVTDCKDILENDCSAPSGLYKISLWKSKKIIPVLCDMETAGGGWTVFQKRFNGSVDFYRNSTEYENGFGKLNGEFWLGLKYVQEMADQGTTELRLDLAAARSHNKTGYSTYQNFKLDKSPNYTIHIDPGTSTIENMHDGGFIQHNGFHFSTYDADRDEETNFNCAEVYHTGWWFKKWCYHVNLNGEYVTPGTTRDMGIEGAIVYFELDTYFSLESTKMMFRRV
ncbi:microfibril-associated glycoprotein 4-like [Mercenaria mercenaria]|uniref:microfibril-associated glycoprotein 4-like n=1 Tax=Mercenaria mercenaria TaxID=6596 RepID=UPI00234ED283|nr:microfibril-associated glycoprotein 4-like [Mercenaria mercenaria]